MSRAGFFFNGHFKKTEDRLQIAYISAIVCLFLLPRLIYPHILRFVLHIRKDYKEPTRITIQIRHTACILPLNKHTLQNITEIQWGN